MAEDGTLVSSPWPDGADDRHAVDREIALFAARPLQPTFAPDPFFFRFDLSSASAARDGAYSGFYLDLGGRGLVSTVMRPIAAGAAAPGGILAADLSFDVDWPAFAATVASPVESAAGDRARPIVAVLGSSSRARCPAGAPPDLRSAVTSLAARDLSPPAADDRPPLQHAIVRGAGAVAAFQMSDDTWLVMRFPQRAPVFPVTAVLLLAGVLAMLLAGFEINRRRADRERVRSERALAEKQNLLNTMQVPLVVVDPNTDAIVSANRAAESIGIRAGGRFADIVWPDDRARAHYAADADGDRRAAARLWRARRRARRARTRSTPRYAIVRSVAVTAPIDALAADERHRLGVLFLLEPDADLALLTDDLESSARRDERRRLAGLLSHGVDTLARVLEHALRQPDTTHASREFTTWLADYLERRIRVAAWLLDHWDATPPLAPDSVVDRDQFVATLDRWQAILATVGADRGLRARLHWDNGVLASPRPDGRIFEVNVDWPESLQFTTPVRGAFGLFVGEVIANAVQHGAPATLVDVSVYCDRVRRELVFDVTNSLHPEHTARPAGDAYGGLAMLRTIARLCEWREFRFESGTGTFQVTWRVPLSERGVQGAD